MTRQPAGATRNGIIKETSQLALEWVVLGVSGWFRVALGGSGWCEVNHRHSVPRDNGSSDNNKNK